MKKIKIFLILSIIISALFVGNSFGNCKYFNNNSETNTVRAENCIGLGAGGKNEGGIANIDGSKLNFQPTNANGDSTGATWLNTTFRKSYNIIASFLAILAIGAITLGSYFLIFNFGNDDKIKKGKDIIKWTLIGFIMLAGVWLCIRIIIYIMYLIGDRI